MWTKIHKDEQSKKLQIGTIILEYPVSGPPSDSIDFNDMNNLNSYQVVLINPMTGEIDLSIPAMETADQDLLANSLGFNRLPEDAPVLHKFFEDLKEEKVWWVEEADGHKVIEI